MNLEKAFEFVRTHIPKNEPLLVDIDNLEKVCNEEPKIAFLKFYTLVSEVVKNPSDFSTFSFLLGLTFGVIASRMSSEPDFDKVLEQFQTKAKSAP